MTPDTPSWSSVVYLLRLLSRKSRMGIVSPEHLEDLLDEIEKEVVGVRSFSMQPPKSIRSRIHLKINRLERDMLRRAGASHHGDREFFERMEHKILNWTNRT